MTDLVVFHYHFLPGGVSGVVRAAVRALRLHAAGIRRITLVGSAFPRSGFPGDGSELEVQPCPELGYAEGQGRRSLAAARELGEELLRRFGSDNAVWWVHNHQLGRNPVFTQAILHIARSGRQRLILQIHDFPESGRYANLARLQRTLAAPPYPVCPSVLYALINGRDLGVLREAGIPEDRLHLLEDPLELEAGRRPDASGAVKRALGLPAGRRPLLLYPVRSIRRKNILEAALLCRLAGADLAVTLPGVSAAERGYSRRVERAFARGWAPGVFGAGPRLEAQGLRPEDLFRASELVLSSSVQEGFGYLFLQSLVWGKPLLARDLDVLDGMRALFEGRPAAFYREVRVPLGAMARRKLFGAYRGKLARLAGQKVLPQDVTEQLEGQLARMCAGPAVDFSFLPPAWQLGLLRAAGRNSRLCEELREGSGEPLAALECLLEQGRAPGRVGSADPEPDARIEQRFGLRRFAEDFAGICASFDRGPSVGAPDEAAVWDRVIRRFATTENVRLLHGD